MDTAMTLNWMEMRRASSARTRLDEHTRSMQITRDNVKLSEENQRLRRENEALAASAEIWIRLYEAALQRANEAERRGR